MFSQHLCIRHWMNNSNKKTSAKSGSDYTLYIVIGICILIAAGGGYWWWMQEKKSSPSSVKDGSPSPTNQISPSPTVGSPSPNDRTPSNPSTLIQTYFRTNAYDPTNKTGETVKLFLQQSFTSPPYTYRFLSPNSITTMEYSSFRINIVTSDGTSNGTVETVRIGWGWFLAIFLPDLSIKSYQVFWPKQLYFDNVLFLEFISPDYVNRSPL